MVGCDKCFLMGVDEMGFGEIIGVFVVDYYI